MTSELSRTELRTLYRELILEHARNPRHFGELEQATHRSKGLNPLCGDRLELFLRMDRGTIEQAGFTGAGCAISVASASLLTETVSGMQSEQALALGAALISHLGQAAEEPAPAAAVDFGPLRALEGVAEFPSRVKCATLAWQALRSAIHSETIPATTE